MPTLHTAQPVMSTAIQMMPPHGLQEIVSTFGDIFDFMHSDENLDPRWESEMLTRITLPFSLPLSWNPEIMVDQIRCHKLLADVFSHVFSEIEQQGLAGRVNSLGGCFSFRRQRA